MFPNHVPYIRRVEYMFSFMVRVSQRTCSQALRRPMHCHDFRTAGLNQEPTDPLGSMDKFQGADELGWGEKKLHLYFH